jgi:hypothetical protein
MLALVVPLAHGDDIQLTPAVTSRGEQREPRSGALWSWAASPQTVYCTA